MKRVFLYVYGDEISALDFSKNCNPQQVYVEMMEKGIKKHTISNKDMYCEIEIVEFESVSADFIHFLTNNMLDEELLKSKDLFIVNEKETKEWS